MRSPPLVLGAKPLSEKVSRGAFLLYILFLQLASAHHLLVEPALSSEWKVFNTSYAMYLAVLGSLIHGMTVPGAIEAAQRKKGFTHGVFEWLRRAPWDNPAFAGMFLSLVMFGFLGGISGVVLGTEQINLIMHNTLYVPGHFHATVVAGTTLAFMAITYLLIPLIFQRELVLPKLARWQPYLFGLGAAGISVFMMGAGTLGVSRRHWDITFSEAIFTFDYPATAFLMMGLNGIAALTAALGGVVYVVVVVGSILFGKKLTGTAMRESKLIAPCGPEVAATYGSAGTWHLPGTYILVAIFFITFVLYYFVNWKYLSEIWPMGRVDGVPSPSHQLRSAPRRRLRALLDVFKLRIGLIMLCALAGIAVTPGPALAGWQVAVLALAVLSLRPAPGLSTSTSSATWMRACSAPACARSSPVSSIPAPAGSRQSGCSWPARCSSRRLRPTGSRRCTCFSARSFMAWSTPSGSSGVAGPTSWSAASPAALPCSPAPPRSIRPWRRSR